MNEKIRELAKQAGFIFWEDEPWKPEGAQIDWSCQYDDDFIRYSHLLVGDIRSLLDTIYRDTPVEQCAPLLKLDSEIQRRYGV